MFKQANHIFTRRTLHEFTLVEMLVVIAIIAILASMMMPQLKNALDSARKISCMNNLRQIYMAINMYADFNKGFYPPIDEVGNTNPRWNVRLVLQEYLDKEILKCPEQSRRPVNWWIDWPDYGMNYYLNTVSGTSYKLSTQKRADIKIFILDSWRSQSDGSANEDSGYYRVRIYPTPSGTYFGQPATRHQSSCDVLYLDGHTKYHALIPGLSVFSQKPFRFYEDREYITWDTPAWSLGVD